MVTLALPAVPSIYRLPPALLAMVALPAVLVSRKYRAPLFVMAALPALLVLLNCRELSLETCHDLDEPASAIVRKTRMGN